MKFEIYKSGKDWRFRLIGRNGEIVATGESYTRKKDCITTICRIIDDLRFPEIPIVDTKGEVLVLA